MKQWHDNYGQECSSLKVFDFVLDISQDNAFIDRFVFEPSAEGVFKFEIKIPIVSKSIFPFSCFWCKTLFV